MITLIDEIKCIEYPLASNEAIMDSIENLNFSSLKSNPRGSHKFQEKFVEVVKTKSLHRLSHPIIAIYNHSRLLYNMVNDHIFTREEAKLSGEEELRSFIGSRENIDFFKSSGDVHLMLAISFIMKTQSSMGFKQGQSEMNDYNWLEADEITDIE